MMLTIADASRLTIAFPTPWAFGAEGLVVDGNGRLVLADLPALPTLTESTFRDWISGLVVDCDRVLYVAGDGTAIGSVDCGGGVNRFGAIGGGHGHGQIADAAGLALGPHATVLVADRGNDRIQQFDLATGQLLWVWEDLPAVEDVTVADDGTILAATANAVVALGFDQPATPVFSTDTLGRRPHSLHASTSEDRPRLLVSVGLQEPRLHCLDQADDGSWSVHDSGRLQDALDRATGRRVGERPPPGPRMIGPLAVAGFGDRLYVSSCRSRAMTVVDLAAESILGVVHPSEGAAAPSGVTVDDDGVLWATDGSTATVSVRSEPVALGRGRVGPIPLALDPEDRHWLRILATGRIGPTELAVTPTFTPRHWVAGAARDGAAEAHDKRVEVPPRTDGVVLDIELRRAPTADGPNPFLERLELRIDEPGLIELLPAVYRSEGRPQAFLDPFLRLAQSSVDEIIDRLTDLPTQFDPMTAKDADDERWLDWLAGWVDARLDETWTTDTRRAAVGTAFARHAVAGTAAALVEEIKAELGIDRVDIVEPGDVASVWVLGDSGSELGTSTMTAAAPAVGSVTGVTAAVDGSHLIGPGDYGAPLFGDLAHCFVVRVHQADVARPEQRQRLEALIEREKPVLTRAHVCAVEPGISLGLQGSIGVDTVIGPPRRAGAVDGLPRLGRSANTTGLPDTGGRHPATTVIP